MSLKISIHSEQLVELKMAKVPHQTKVFRQISQFDPEIHRLTDLSGTKFSKPLFTISLRI